MKSRHHESTPVPVCPTCKENYPREETPSGICHKCQVKIGVIILIIMVITSGMVFFGIIGWW
ncbi:MAG TPA: hypothetical protein VMC42_08245 [Methanoregulaceae archaeon]|nr:hypothetical protein [Methanoregulaceae archaeon]